MLLSIKVGRDAKVGPNASPLGVDEILIRGPSSEVDRAVKEIQKLVADAKNNEIDNGFVSFLFILWMISLNLLTEELSCISVN